MASFTEWIASERIGSSTPMAPDDIGRLVQEIQPKLMQRLQARFPNGRAFGEDHADDLSQRAIVWLLGFFADRDADGEKPPASESPKPRTSTISDRVIDRDTLCCFLYEKACKWSYDRWRRRSGGTGLPAEGGGSRALADGESEVTAATFARISDDLRRGGAAFEAPEAASDCDDSLAAAIEDLRSWSSPEDRLLRAFVLRIEHEYPASRIGDELGLATATVNSYLRRAKFCLKRRFGYSRAALAAEFGAQADTWETELAIAGRPRSPD